MQTNSLIKPPKSRMLKSGRVILSPGEEIGEHITEKREEQIIVLKGRATLIIGNEKIELKERDTYYIKENVQHNVQNNYNKELEYIYTVVLFS